MVHRLSEMRDPRVLFLLRAALHLPEEAVVLAAIEGLDTMRAAVAIPWLEELAQCGSTKMIRQEAGRVAGHLTMRSSVPGAAAIREMPSLAEAQWPLHSCWLTIIDGVGGQVAFVTRKRPDGRLAMVDIMFTDHEGLKDCFGTDMMEPEEFHEMLCELGNGGITAVEVSLERCRQVVEQAYDRTLAVGRQLPLEYFAWVDMLSGEDSRSMEEWPVEEVDIAAYPELVGQSIHLLTLEEMSTWSLSPEEVHALAGRNHRLFSRPRVFRPGILRMLRQGVKSAVAEDRRSLLANRLRRQAWLLAQIYAEEEVWQWAMAASAGLSQGRVASDRHPLLLGMMAAGFDDLLGTEFLPEMMDLEKEAWVSLVQGTSAAPTAPQSALSEWAKLCSFLQEVGLEIPADLTNLASTHEPGFLTEGLGPVQGPLCELNRLESVFGEEIEDDLFDTGGLNWRRLREELGLIPSTRMKSPALQEIEAGFVNGMEMGDCSPMMIARARQLWDDYVLLTGGQVGPLRKPQSWAAGTDYLVRLLYFDWKTQAEVGDSYGVSAATVSQRFRTLHGRLGVWTFAYPFDKELQIMVELEGWSQLNPEEIGQRLSEHTAQAARVREVEAQE
jgi:hypothetical protein